jgi:hypothetical protein
MALVGIWSNLTARDRYAACTQTLMRDTRHSIGKYHCTLVVVGAMGDENSSLGALV